MRNKLPILTATVLSRRGGSITSLPGTLTVWRAALAAAGTQRVKVLVIGDSVGVGWNATNRLTQGWVPLWRATLQAAYGDGGGSGQGDGAEGAYWMDDAGWTRNVGFANADGFGLFLFSAKGTVGDYMTRNWTGRYLAVHWKGSTSNSAVFTVTIDGGAPQNVNGAANNNYNVTEFDAGSDGDHTLRIDAPSTASKYAWITGCIPYKSLVGVSVINASYAGRRIATYVDGAFGSALDEMVTIDPDLIIYSLSINDYNTQQAIATITTKWGTAMSKAGTAGGSTFLICNNDIQAVQAIPYTSYRDVILAQARANNSAYLNVYDLWGRYAIANAKMLMGDATHPSTGGQADMKEKINALVG